MFSPLFVCFFSDDISKIDAARITKLDIDMVHHDSGYPFILGVKGQGHEAQKVPAWVFVLVFSS